jgi:hypothetical protein
VEQLVPSGLALRDVSPTELMDAVLGRGRFTRARARDATGAPGDD